MCMCAQSDQVSRFELVKKRDFFLMSKFAKMFPVVLCDLWSFKVLSNISSEYEKNPIFIVFAQSTLLDFNFLFVL